MLCGRVGLGIEKKVHTTNNSNKHQIIIRFYTEKMGKNNSTVEVDFDHFASITIDLNFEGQPTQSLEFER